MSEKFVKTVISGPTVWQIYALIPVPPFPFRERVVSVCERLASGGSLDVGQSECGSQGKSSFGVGWSTRDVTFQELGPSNWSTSSSSGEEGRLTPPGRLVWRRCWKYICNSNVPKIDRVRRFDFPIEGIPRPTTLWISFPPFCFFFDGPVHRADLHPMTRSITLRRSSLVRQCRKIWS